MVSNVYSSTHQFALHLRVFFFSKVQLKLLERPYNLVLTTKTILDVSIIKCFQHWGDLKKDRAIVLHLNFFSSDETDYTGIAQGLV